MNEEHPLNILAEQTEKQDKNTNVNSQINGGIGSIIPNNIQSNNPPIRKNFVQQPIRTYESDVAKIMGTGKASKATMVIAEKKRKKEEMQAEKEALLRQQAQEESKLDKNELLSNRNLYSNRDFQKDQFIEKNQNLPQSEIYVPPKQEVEIEEPVSQIPKPVAPSPIPINKGNVIPIRTIPTISMVKGQSMDELGESEPREVVSVPSKYNPGNIKKVIQLLFGVIFIAGGLYGGYYFYTKSPIASPPAPVVKKAIPSVITPDSQKVFAIDDLSSTEIINGIYALVNKENLSSGKIFEVIPTLKSGENAMLVTGDKFIEKTGIDMPDQLQRSLSNKMMVGGVKDDAGENTVFLALTTNFFQNSYAGMLSWEKDMPDELDRIMNYKYIVDNINSEASTTINNYFGIRGKFVDKQIRNRDVREFIHESGQIFFLYSFIDKNTLIIARSESAMAKIVDKIEKQTYIR